MTEPGWGGHTPRLHWLVDGRAICGTRTKSADIERDVTEKYIRDFGCWHCRARLAASRDGRTATEGDQQ